MRQTVVLAAGNGRRLGGEGYAVPKPLVEVDGRPLIEHALQQAAAAGCEEAVVVVGYHAQEITEHLNEVSLPITIRIIHNDRPDLPNGVSLLHAARVADERFFLQMVDHVFTRPVLQDLEKGLRRFPGLLVDRTPVHMDEDDATKVTLVGDRVTGIGKGLAEWDAIDAGYFQLDGRVFDALRAVTGGAPSVSDGMRVLVSRGELRAVSLMGAAWVDVDTPRDREVAEVLLGGATPVPQ